MISMDILYKKNEISKDTEPSGGSQGVKRGGRGQRGMAGRRRMI